MNNLLPKWSKTYYSTRPKAELMQQLESMTYKDSGWHLHLLGSDGKPYRGSVGSDQFKIRPAISYRNTFLPVIFGEVSETDQQTVITVKVELSPMVKRFMFCWLSITLIHSVFSIICMPWLIFQDEPLTSTFVSTSVSLLMFVLGYFFMNMGFNMEKEGIISGLNILFEG